MKIIICSIKSWNLEKARQMKMKYNGIHEIHIISDKDKLFQESNKISPDYIFFPHWSYIIPSEIYENFECVVFHMTDLPFGRGGSPLQNLIVREIYETKISALRVTKELDAGPIYLKEFLSLIGNADEIFRRAADIIFDKMIPYIIDENPTPIPQEGEPIIFCRRKPEDGEIFYDMPLYKMYDYIRMLDGEGYPRAYMNLGRYKLEFFNAAFKNGKLTAMVEFVDVSN